MKIRYVVPFTFVFCISNVYASTCAGTVVSNNGTCDLSGDTWSVENSYRYNIYSDIDKYGIVVDSENDSITLKGLVNLDSNAVDPSRYISSFTDVKGYQTAGEDLDKVTGNLVLRNKDDGFIYTNATTLIPDPSNEGSYLKESYYYYDLDKASERNVNSLESGLLVFNDVSSFYNKAYKTLNLALVKQGSLTLEGIVKDYGNVALRENSVLFDVQSESGDSKSKSILTFDKDTDINISATPQAYDTSYNLNITNVYDTNLINDSLSLKLALDSCVKGATTSTGVTSCQEEYNDKINKAMALYAINIPITVSTKPQDKGDQSGNNLLSGNRYIVKATGSNSYINMAGKLTGSNINSSNGLIFLDNGAILNVATSGLVAASSGIVVSANNNSRVENSGLIIAGDKDRTYRETNDGRSLNNSGSSVTISNGSVFYNTNSGVYLGETYTNKGSGDNYTIADNSPHKSIIVSSSSENNTSQVINDGAMYFGGDVNTLSKKIDTGNYNSNVENTKAIIGIYSGNNSVITNNNYMALGITIGSIDDASLPLSERVGNYHQGSLPSGSSIISNYSLGSSKSTTGYNAKVFNNGTLELGENTNHASGVQLRGGNSNVTSDELSQVILNGKNSSGYYLAYNAGADLSGHYTFNGSNNNIGIRPFYTSIATNIGKSYVNSTSSANQTLYANTFVNAQVATVNLNNDVIITDENSTAYSLINGFDLDNSTLNIKNDSIIGVKNTAETDAIILRGKSSIVSPDNKLSILMDNSVNDNSKYKGIVLSSDFSSNNSSFDTTNISMDINSGNSIGIDDNSAISNINISDGTSILTQGGNSIAVNIGANPSTTTKNITNDGVIYSDSFAVKTNDSSLYNTTLVNNNTIQGISKILSGYINTIVLNANSIGDKFVIGGISSGTINLVGADNQAFKTLSVDTNSTKMSKSELTVNLTDGSVIDFTKNENKKITGFDDINVYDNSVLSIYNDANIFQDITSKGILTNVNILGSGVLNLVDINNPDYSSVLNKDIFTGDGTINVLNGTNITFDESVKDFHGDINIVDSYLTLGEHFSSSVGYPDDIFDIRSINVDENSTLRINNDGTTYVKGVVSNLGVIDLNTDSSNQSLFIDGDYVGGAESNTTSKLIFNTIWDNDKSISDTLVINKTATGYSEVKIINSTIGSVSSDEYEKYSIPIITVNDHTMGSNSFYGFADTEGAEQALLVQKDANNYAWYLPGKPTKPTDPTEPTEPTEPTKPTEPTDPTKPTEPTKPTKPTPTKPETSGFVRMPTANMEMGYSLIRTLHERIGEQQTMAWDDCAQCQLTHKNGQVWGKFIGDAGRVNGDNRYGYKSTLYGVQFGYDFDIDVNVDTGSRRHSGAMITYAHDDLKFNDSKSVFFDTDKGQYSTRSSQNGTGDSDTIAIGGYTTYYDANGSYLDLVGNVDYTHNKYKSNRSSSSNNSYGIALSAEVGRPYALTENGTNNGDWMIEPQAQLIYQYRTFSSMKTLNDVNVEQSNRNGLRGRVGGRLAYNTGTDELKTNTVYFTGNIVHDFISNDQSVTIGTSNIKEKTASTFGEVGVGIQLPLGDTSYMYMDTRYRHSLGNNDGKAEGISGNIGLKYHF